MNMNYIKRTATEWAKLAGFEIADADGFRGKDGVTLETPIDIFDFAKRANECTICPIRQTVPKVPKLVYTAPDLNTHLNGSVVNVGDKVQTSNGETVIVEHFRFPHKPSSSGKVSIRPENSQFSQEVYVSVIGAEWIDRNDRD